MSRKNIFGKAIAKPSAAGEAGQREPPVQRASSVGALGRILDSVADENRRAHDTQRELENLKRQLRDGANVQEIDPALVDPSPIRDRLDDPGSAKAESLRASIAESGQRVPALLRAHPAAPGRYLTVFGHRRVAAVKALGRPLRAIVVEMADEEAFVAQGQENNERDNTSFIERCLFAKRLKAFGLKGVQITAAISTDKTTVSRMIDIAEKAPEDILAAIGPAPAIGRPRWQALAEILPDKAAVARRLIADDDFRRLGSDERFHAVFAAAMNGPDKKLAAANFSHLADRNGAKFALVKRSARGEVTVRIPNDDGSARGDSLSFGEWLESRMASLRDEWLDGE
jgi:ParB family chromosome partitioning protein